VSAGARRPGLAAVVCAAASMVPTVRGGDGGPGAPAETNAATLDFAADTSGGAWCTSAHDDTTAAARSLEGWFRPSHLRGGILFEVTAGDGSGAIRAALTAEARVVLEGPGLAWPGEPLLVQTGAWTHYRLDLTSEGLRLSLWDRGRGSRSLAARRSEPSWPGGRGTGICVGGGRGGDRPFAGWVDDVRVWSTALSDDVAAAWRERRLTADHPLWAALLASWPFRRGEGGEERGEGALGPLTSESPVWVALPRLTYGPLLRGVDSRSVRVLFAAGPAHGGPSPWAAGLEIRKAGVARWLAPAVAVEVGPDTDYVAHLRRDGLEPQTSYVYLPIIDGRAAAAGPPETLPRFTTPPDLGGRNADFTVVFFADQHTPDTREGVPLPAYGAALDQRPLFWAQLGDVVPGSTDGRTVEHKRGPDMLRALWARNFGNWDSPQAGFLRRVPLGIATISDHEITDNYDLNWHRHDYAAAASREAATLADRIRQYDVSLARWWNHLGWGAGADDALARAARADFGTSAMGLAYATPGLYHGLRPYPFVEFFVLDTTSYRGDTYQSRDHYARTANRDTDHARYPWNAGNGRFFVFGDRAHGANATTDGVRSWLGAVQKRAFLAALRGSTAQVIVVAAGYPLYSYKFEDHPTYWEGREAGFDFATEAEELVSALQRADRLVLWVHGDGHTPALVRLRKNLYQLQVGPTVLAGGGTGHRSRSLGSGSRSRSDLVGGGTVLATHQPDLGPGDATNDVFRGGLDTFEGYLRLYFHPGQEALRSSERAGLHRAAADDAVEVALAADPARNRAGRLVVGRVARVRFGPETRHAVVSGYRYAAGRAVFQLDAPVVRADPDELRILVDAVPWVEARWFDAEGREWRDLAGVLRREP
jgi:PhoD-like phosphatase/concanavalin A-like lectin/glucanase superfamily protein